MTRHELLALCGSTRWAELVSTRAPFHSADELHHAADAAFDRLATEDWLEAFRHHPRIGDVEALRERFAASGAMSEQEQAGLAGADGDVVQALADGNEEYELRHGFVFLVRAAGRTAAELLELQRERLGNDRDVELRVAAGQQREITHLRIDQAFDQD